MEGKKEKSQQPELTSEEIKLMQARVEQLQTKITVIDREAAQRKKPLEDELEAIKGKLATEFMKRLKE